MVKKRIVLSVSMLSSICPCKIYYVHHSLLYKRKTSILLFLIAICILPCKVLCNRSITNLWRAMKYIPICTCVSDNTKILNDVLFHILQSGEQKFFKHIYNYFIADIMLFILEYLTSTWNHYFSFYTSFFVNIWKLVPICSNSVWICKFLPDKVFCHFPMQQADHKLKSLIGWVDRMTNSTNNLSTYIHTTFWIYNTSLYG